MDMMQKLNISSKTLTTYCHCPATFKWWSEFLGKADRSYWK